MTSRIDDLIERGYEQGLKDKKSGITIRDAEIQGQKTRKKFKPTKVLRNGKWIKV